ncbi:recombinase family protein [Sulfuriflexus sp.]|uniref:recombinase family protein n=1 Tax=Sulfuriflexus sp. TaxID=2015443 RepID=UPI0028CE65A5|nr:recombinase family protein [Sulfuriflexus sp.]MDT8405567.1 recombinase family protein [Sulfuriflexus sp.]
MSTSELVTRSHLARKAIIYVRQSTPHQVLSNQESLRLQYALERRAQELGWPEANIETIDTDLAVSAASARFREGFKEMVSQVALGQVGIIVSSEVQRLSRNCSDWYPLLDVCGYKNCLIGDRDGIYNPASPNGRLLLGIKGQLSEMELHLIQARMTAGLLNKAKRGELALPLPTGLTRDDLGRVVKDPNIEVQQRIQLVFDTFLRLRTASKVLRFFAEHSLLIPRRDRFGEPVWRRPSMTAIIEILKNPAYAGAFVYGRTKTVRDDSGKARQKRLPMEQWRILVHDKYPAYIDWQTFERIQAMLKDNHASYERNKTCGVPRKGAALLQGLVYCGECGHKMLVEYKHGVRYVCDYRRRHYQGPVCQYIPGTPIEERVVDAFFQVLSPVELDAYEQALAAQKETDEKVDQAHQQQLARLRYEAELAQRQYNRVDPDNRLVAAELERRWEAALRALKEAEDSYGRKKKDYLRLLPLPAELKEAFLGVGQNLPQLWQGDVLRPEQKKALLRCLVEKVVIHREPRDCIQTRIVWQGGDTTTLQIPIPVGSFAELSKAAEMEQLIVDLSREERTDEEIAAYLTAHGYRSPTRPDKVLPSTVRGIRLKHDILQERPRSNPRRIPGHLTVPQVAQHLEITPNAIHYHIKNGRIQVAKDPQTGLYLFPDEPETLAMFRQFRAGKLQNLRFPREHQDD